MKKKNPFPKAKPGNRKILQKEETRRVILESARDLFNELGFSKTSTRAIAENASVGTGTVFSHFPDKSSLLIAVLLDDLKATQDEALKTMPVDSSVCEKFLHISQYFYLYYSKQPDLSRTLLKEMWFVKGKWGGELISQAHQYGFFIFDLIKEAKQKGDIHPETDAMLCARAFFFYYLNVLLEGMNEPEINIDEMIDRLRDLLNQLLKGVGPDNY